jgi:hypothetical protein
MLAFKRKGQMRDGPAQGRDSWEYFSLLVMCAALDLRFWSARVSSRIARTGTSAVDPFLLLASGSY